MKPYIFIILFITFFSNIFLDKVIFEKNKNNVKNINNETIFIIDQKTENSLCTEKNTFIIIPRNCFVSLKGKKVTSEITIKIKEIISLEDIVLNNLQTVTKNNNLLQTGSIIYISAIDKKGRELKIAENKQILIDIHGIDLYPNLTVYNLAKNNSDIWLPYNKLEKNIIALPFNAFNFENICVNFGCSKITKEYLSFLYAGNPNTFITTREFYTRAWYIDNIECFFFRSWYYSPPTFYTSYEDNLVKNLSFCDSLFLQFSDDFISNFYNSRLLEKDTFIYSYSHIINPEDGSIVDSILVHSGFHNVGVKIDYIHKKVFADQVQKLSYLTPTKLLIVDNLGINMSNSNAYKNLIKKNISEIEADSIMLLYNFQQLIINEQKTRTLHWKNYPMYFNKKYQKDIGIPKYFKFTFYIKKLGYFLIGSEYKTKQETGQLDITIENNKIPKLNCFVIFPEINSVIYNEIESEKQQVTFKNLPTGEFSKILINGKDERNKYYFSHDTLTLQKTNTQTFEMEKTSKTNYYKVIKIFLTPQILIEK